MPPVGAERWFHTLVVVGAALGGCGGETAERSLPAPSGSGGVSGTGSNTTLTIGGSTSGTSSASPSGGAPTGPSACAYDAQFVCDDYAARTNCRCDAQAPRELTACQSPLDYTCTEWLCPWGSACDPGHYVGCHCDPSGLRPTDCATPEQFFCNTTYPLFAHCACSPNPAPTSCGSNAIYCCQSESPRFGCGCECIIIK